VRLARALVALAVRRSPAADREDDRREWEAELAVLAAEGRGGPALRYAASLALARPRGGPTLTWRGFRLIVIAPVVATVALFLGVVPTRLASAVLGADTQTSLMAVFAAGLAVAAGLLGRRWAVRVGTGWRILAVTVPGWAVGVLFNAGTASPASALQVHAPAFLVFFAGLAVALTLAGRLPRFGAVAGAAVALVAAHVATVVMMALSGVPLDFAYAPAWLFVSLTGFGVEGMPPGDALLVWDVTGFDTYLFVVFAGLAFGAVLRPPAGAAPSGSSRPAASGAR
jgi:hypothetical protein